MKIPPLAAPALIFFCNAFLFISLFSRLPGLTVQLQIDKSLLGLSLLGATGGTFLALPVASRVVQRLTPRITAGLMLPSIALVLLVAFSVTQYWAFVLCLVAFGYCRTLLDVAQNLVAAQIENDTGEHVIARSHGFWSVGLLGGSLFSGLMGGLGVNATLHMLLAGLVALPLVAAMVKVAPKTMSVVPNQKRGIVLPDRAILLVCAMMFGIAVTEGAIYDWGAFYIEQVLDADPAAVGLLFSCFTIGMGATRMIGDMLRARFPAPTLLRGSALTVFAGILVLLWSPSLWVAALALGMIGCGVALNAPLAITTAARIGTRSAPENLAALSFVSTLAFLGVPASLGFVADHFGLKIAFAVLLVPLMLTFALAPITGTRRAQLQRGEAVPAE